MESLTVRDADGQRLAVLDRHVPGERVPIAWDGRHVRLELGSVTLLELERPRLDTDEDIRVDLRSLTGALELHAPPSLDPSRIDLDCVSGGGRFAPVIDGQRVVFPYLPPGRADVVLRGTANTPVPGCPDLRDRTIVAGRTIRTTMPALDQEGSPSGQVVVEHDRPPRVFAAPAWSDGLPVRDWEPSMAVVVRPDGRFRFRDLPFPPTHVVFFHRAGERAYDRVVLALEPWGPVRSWSLPLGDLLVDVRSADGASGSFRVGLRHAALAARMARPTEWRSRIGPGPIRFTAVPVGPAEVLVPPHSGASPARVVIPRTAAPRVPIVFR